MKVFLIFFVLGSISLSMFLLGLYFSIKEDEEDKKHLDRIDLDFNKSMAKIDYKYYFNIYKKLYKSKKDARIKAKKLIYLKYGYDIEKEIQLDS